MKFCILTVLLLSTFICKSQTISDFHSTDIRYCSLDSITTIVGGSETNDTYNRRIVFLSDSTNSIDSVSSHDENHTYHISIYGAYKKDTLIYILLKSNVRKFMNESVFAKTAKIRANQELKISLSDSSIVVLKANNIEYSSFPMCINYCHYQFNVSYSISEKDIEKLKKYHIIKIAQDYGNGFLLIAKPKNKLILF